MATHNMSVDDGRRERLVNVDLPGNSHTIRNEKKEDEQKPRVKKVISGSVVTRKKPLGRRIISMFVGEEISNVKEYLFYDVFIPAVKNTVSEAIDAAKDMLLFNGEVRSYRDRRDHGRTRVSYDKYYDKGKRPERREMQPRNRARHNFDDLVIETRGEAEEVIGNLVDLIEDYGEATVRDLYDAVGVQADHVDEKWGWENLSSARPIRVRDGYLLDLPKPILLER